jgi:hypothetical protein
MKSLKSLITVCAAMCELHGSFMAPLIGEMGEVNSSVKVRHVCRPCFHCESWHPRGPCRLYIYSGLDFLIIERSCPTFAMMTRSRALLLPMCMLTLVRGLPRRGRTGTTGQSRSGLTCGIQHVASGSATVPRSL